MKRNKALPEAAAEITHTAADRAQEFVDAAIEKLTPLIEQAGEQLTPKAQDAKKKTAAFASTQMDKAQPALEDALDKLVNDLLPKLQDGLRHAAEIPGVGDAIEPLAESIPTSKKDLKKAGKKAQKQAEAAAKRGKATVAALKGELELPQRKRSTGKVVGSLAAATALVGAAAVLLRKYLNQTDESGWAAHEPSMAYTRDADEAAEDVKDAAKGFVADAKDKASDLADKAKDSLDDAKDKIADTVEDAKDKAEETGEDVAKKVEEAKDYGIGSFIGEHAPEGFAIKGNERSMKYHVEGTEGYERTIADVWFESEEAAEAAGFTKAQR